MNRLEGTVVDPGTGAIQTVGGILTVEAARSKARGARVLVLIRPETVQVAAANGAGPNTLTGEVLTHTFLGSTTRVKVIGAGVDLIADVPTSRIASVPVGMSVIARVPAEGVRLLSLAEQPASAEPVPAGP